MVFGGDAMLLLPGGEKVGMRGFSVVENSHASSPLTLPSSNGGEGN